MLTCAPTCFLWLVFAGVLGCLTLFGLYLSLAKPDNEARKWKKGESINSGDPPDRASLYTAAIQLIIHAENTTWTRTYNFLTANSILMLAWATIFAGASSGYRNAVLCILSLVGLFLSIAWAPFGSRSRRYMRRYVNIAMALEQNETKSQEQGPDGPLNAGEKLEFLCVEKAFKSQHLAVIVPLTFAAAFSFSFLASVLTK